jgi:hypothetical protein
MTCLFEAIEKTSYEQDKSLMNVMHDELNQFTKNDV